MVASVPPATFDGGDAIGGDVDDGDVDAIAPGAGHVHVLAIDADGHRGDGARHRVGRDDLTADGVDDGDRVVTGRRHGGVRTAVGDGHGERLAGDDATPHGERLGVEHRKGVVAEVGDHEDVVFDGDVRDWTPSDHRGVQQGDVTIVDGDAVERANVLAIVFGTSAGNACASNSFDEYAPRRGAV